MIKKHWWKILAVILCLYSLVAGMLIPLKPGIVTVEKINTADNQLSTKTGGVLNLKVNGYNTNFTNGEGSIRAWLKLDTSYAIIAQNVDVISDQELTAQFLIPEFLPYERKVTEASLLIDYPSDGAFVQPSAIFINQTATNIAKGKALWSFDPVGKLHQFPKTSFPYRSLLSETIRNLFYHVPLWFGMMFIFLISVVYSSNYLRKEVPSMEDDQKAVAFTAVGVVFGMLGLITGAIWANYTWGKPWSWDVKQNMSAIAMLIYLAYFVLRGSFEEEERKGRIAAIYNIFAFAALIPLLFVIPRMTDSLHPGNGGNPGFGGEDLDNTMRMVFYPAIIGWTLLGVWMANLMYRINILKEQFYTD